MNTTDHGDGTTLCTQTSAAYSLSGTTFTFIKKKYLLNNVKECFNHFIFSHNIFNQMSDVVYLQVVFEKGKFFMI